ncbi:endospore germination permease [Brevibacillus brevis]|uniref:GerAB/ArcD/ProY family transporter n=1 Tax=Brevibacillus brevis TaxID=1393 RepID=A0A517IFA9_BREBE|nr:endospore germination permease [Brevibacillus brevis]QDS37585.1 GerAB/ArcD/ProY family transporter [Brevibacillus brevis]
MYTTIRSIRFGQVMMIFLLSTGLMNHVTVIPFLLSSAGKSSWVSVLVAAGLVSIWVPLIPYIMWNTNMEPLFTWIQIRFGRIVSLLLLVPAMIFVFFFGTVTLLDTIAWIKTMLLPNTPVWFLTFWLMLACLWAAVSGSNVIARASVFLLPFVVILGFFVSTANIPNKNYSHLLPILEDGYSPVVQGLIYISGGLLEIVLLLFLQPLLTKTPKTSKLIFLVWLLCGLTIGPLIGAIAEFGIVEASKQRFPAFEEWRLLEIGKYIDHVDFLSVYQWLAGAFIRIALALLILKNVIPHRSVKRSNGTALGFAFLMFVMACLPYNDKSFYEFLAQWYFPATVWFTLLFSSILFGLIVMSKKRGVNSG